MKYLLLLLPFLFYSCGKSIQAATTPDELVRVEIIENVEGTYYPVEYTVKPIHNSFYYDIDGRMTYRGNKWGLRAVQYGYHWETGVIVVLKEFKIKYDDIKWR